MELIKIYKGSLVDARELHQFLESKQDFSNWITNRIKKYGFEEGKDYTINLLNRSDGLPGKPRKEYALTLNMAKELAMVENNAKGREARRYFIEAEEALRRLADNKRLAAFQKLESTKGKLLEAIKKIGGTDKDYVQIDLTGRTVFFNGTPLPDEEISTLLIKGRDFATEMTNTNMKLGKHTLLEVEELNKQHHEGIRQSIIDGIGQSPERLPKEENIKNIEEKENRLNE